MTITAKIRSLLPVACLLLVFNLPALITTAQNNYPLQVKCVDRDHATLINETGLQTSFTSRSTCVEYVNKLPSFLQSKGFVTASVDSVRFDSASANIVLYLGSKYKWAQIKTSGADPDVLAAAGWNDKMFTNKPIDFIQLKTMQERMLNYLENNGYPFGKIFLDSLSMNEDSVFAILKTDKGPLYKVDSIRVYGDAKISNSFLQRYLGIPNGSLYNKERLSKVSQKINELGFVQEEFPPKMSLLGTGSVLNLYLKHKRSSQVNALVGFLPQTDQSSSKKLIITGEANVNLRNAFGGGEAIGLNWQQLQVKSPRLNIFYRHPYIFNSAFGVDFSFDMLRKDSSYLNINLNLGASYFLSASQSGKIFFQHFQTIISQGGIDADKIIATKQLPDIADVSTASLGIEVEKNKTNYRLNPKSGYEFRVGGIVGTKNIKKNNEILELNDPSDPAFDFDDLYDTVKLNSYQFRIAGTVAKYFPLGKQGAVKTALNAGFIFSDNIYRNELFQIGGYKILRGFDEESQYASQYVVATLEYRYLIGLNSYFYGFVDGGWAKNKSQASDYSHSYIGSGLGIALETKAGIFNLAWAVGKRDDIPFNLRQSKIHVGFVNYF